MGIDIDGRDIGEKIEAERREFEKYMNSVRVEEQDDLERCQTDYDFALEEVKKNPNMLNWLNHDMKIRIAKELALIKHLDVDSQAEIVRSPYYRHYLALATPSVQRQIISENKTRLCYASKEIQMEILKENPLMLEHANVTMLDNKDFVHGLIKQNPLALQFVYGLKDYEDIAIIGDAIDENPQILKDFPENMQRALINQNSNGEKMFKHASIEVQKEFISKKDASYLAYASPEVRNDDEIVKQAISENPSMFQYASDRLRDNVEVQKMAVKQDFNVLRMLPKESRQNPEFEPQRQKIEIVDKFALGAIKLEDVDKQNFVDINFYNSIVQESKNKVLRQFDSLTKNLDMSDKVEEKLQATVEKKLKQIEKKLEHQRNWTLLKNGIKTKIDEIKGEFNKGLEAGRVANKIKNMEL